MPDWIMRMSISDMTAGDWGGALLQPLRQHAERSRDGEQVHVLQPVVEASFGLVGRPQVDHVRQLHEDVYKRQPITA